jgi:uncharacterized membrane protein
MAPREWCARHDNVNSNRLEAFSDGVIAIIITIMVLELKVPHGADSAALAALVPVFLSYVLSFIYVGIYWNNHHHLLHLCDRVNGAILWANLHLLFWLSLFPITTAWLGENPREALPAAVYGVVLLMASGAWLLLQRAIVAAQGANSVLRQALGNDWKGKVSVMLYVAGTFAAFWRPWLSQAVYALAAILWLIPDRRIEREVAMRESQEG